MFRKYFLFLSTCLLIYSCSNESSFVESTPETGDLCVESQPTGAMIFLMGTNTNKLTPDTLKDLSPNEYLITLKLEDYRDTTIKGIVKKGLLSTTSVQLNPKYTTGSVFVNSYPSGSQIWYKGVLIGNTPDTLQSLQIGTHTLTLKYNGYKDTTISFYVTGGKKTELDIILCVDTQTGGIFINSQPQGAQIWYDGINKGNTPYTLLKLSPGNQYITLKLVGYRDTTVECNISGGIQSQLYVVLKSILSLKKFGPLRIYETTGTSSSQPCALDLSAGTAISSSNNEADLIYETNSTFTVHHLTRANTRLTFFKVGNSTDLYDGTDAPAKDLSWTSEMSDNEPNNVFIYDNENHYSKLKIIKVASLLEVPAWIEVEWLYNQTANDLRF